MNMLCAIRFATIFFLLVAPIMADTELRTLFNPPTSGLQPGSTGDASGLSVTAQGGTTARTNADRAADTFNVMDYGAKCDALTDDATAINSAAAAFRTAINAGKSGTLRIPRQCRINSAINLTNITSPIYSAFIDVTGGSILCAATGAVCLDATGSDHLNWIHPHVKGDQTNRPRVGIQISRRSNAIDCAEQRFDYPKTTGYFTFAAFYEVGCETVSFTAEHFENRDTGNSFAYVADGPNYWNVHSAFTSITLGQNYGASFIGNEHFMPTYVGSGSQSAVWLNGTMKHRFNNAYVLTLGSPYGVTIFDNGAFPHTELLADFHVEGTVMTDAFLIAGSTSISLYGFSFIDHTSGGTNSYFKLAPGVSSVTATDAVFRISKPASLVVKLFDDATKWTVAGKITVPATAYYPTPVPGFTGTLCLGSVCTPTVTIPSALTVSSVSNPGGVGSLSFTATGSFRAIKPSCTVTAPPSGGQQAGCIVNTVDLQSYGSISAGGSGYTVNDAITYGGLNCSVYPMIKVAAVDGAGSVTAFTSNNTAQNGGTQPRCNSPAAYPIATTGGTGSGLSMTAAWRVTAANITFTAGAGYTTSPTFTFSSGEAGTVAASATGNLSASFTANAGGGQLLLDSTGSKIGVSGVAGSPMMSLGAMIDNSGVRQSLGGAYTVPANTSLVRFIQADTVASSTVTLPVALADGQPIQFVNYAGSITALTFSPTVNGWTNGSTLAANTGLRVRWDSISNAWYREQ
ncbi:hypothetical protein MKK58_14785 [Methylobacterium sp. J-078]|uniref:hypothetical protein n=1 Tax=Methylobacterium sp. J-078 TaxID=2836657 RepID=UPI001FBC0F41|nr:hypothetical protein [Methylobacterium sp. J-078]MCJ2045785.1 hypothetical protein [Methylobacterium sp. J-078]